MALIQKLDTEPAPGKLAINEIGDLLVDLLAVAYAAATVSVDTLSRGEIADRDVIEALVQVLQEFSDAHAPQHSVTLLSSRVHSTFSTAEAPRI